MKIRDYFTLIKPGIVRANLLTTTAGFLFASVNTIDWTRLLWLNLGTGLVIASGCVINNVIDRGIDSRMERTKKRATVTGDISVTAANIYGFALGLSGFAILILLVNIITAALGLVCIFIYVVVYGYAKRTTWHSTLIGSVVGGIPPAAGYAAATGNLDIAASLLFLILVTWQMPHFYAIALFRRKDYAAAKLPIISVSKGIISTKIAIQVWMVVWFASATALYALGYASVVYQIVMLSLFIYWISAGLAASKKPDNIDWSRRVFGRSLVVLLLFSLMISIDARLFS